MINSEFFYNNVAKQLCKPTKCLVHEFKIHMEHDFKIGKVALGIVPQKKENNQFE
jgi:hypothetical protein